MPPTRRLSDIHAALAIVKTPNVSREEYLDYMTFRANTRPHYRRIWDLLRSRGARLFWIDSDGDMTPILPQLIEAGINVLFPVEPVGGMDIVKLREQYGAQLAFIGGLDKHVLRRSRAEIVAELEYKIPPMVHSGACMLGLDHRIPNGTPIAAYRVLVRDVVDSLNGSRQDAKNAKTPPVSILCALCAFA